MDLDQQVRALDRPTLTPLIRRALRHDDAELVTWDHRRIPHLLGDTALSRVYRLTGAARVGGETRSWSLILKALTRPPEAVAAPGWDREIAAFRSGLLDDLPGGLAAPRCFAIEERPEAVWLWQEDVAGEGDARWSPARFALAARHLGRFSGRSLTGPLPDAPWLSRGLLRGQADRNADFWDGRIPVRDPALLDQLFPDGLLDRARRVWDERYRLLDALDRLPQTLTHGDADRRNLFARRGRDGEEETVAIDWAWMGVAALGDDLVDLAAGSALWFQADPRDLPALAAACLAGYGAGLADAGWPGDARLARVGFAIGTALHYGPCGPFVFRLRYPELAEALARAEGRGPYETVDRLAAVQRFALDQLDAARGDIAAL
ncbi:MAG TPA: hypothetical protein VFW96_03535 [Thermomicrobiales bacterium]|nr:hypothetical protein [Thermomicrobiales bacterium]